MTHLLTKPVATQMVTDASEMLQSKEVGLHWMYYAPSLFRSPCQMLCSSMDACLRSSEHGCIMLRAFFVHLVRCCAVLWTHACAARNMDASAAVDVTGGSRLASASRGRLAYTSK